MLDTLAEAWANKNKGANIWADKSVRFLDPCTKTGIFLREITSRLTKGLEKEIPDLVKRVDHILTKQVFGIGITHLTSLLARRSLYCSKDAKGKHSIAKSFITDAGNIWYERLEHDWIGSSEWVYVTNQQGKKVKKFTNGKCNFCGAPRATFDRDPGLENHVYAFIHTNNIKARITELFGGNMQFDVIIGNPPYQMTGGAGGSSDSSIYQLFVQQAFNLEPRFVSMVIPARWMAGGRGLDEFRGKMLNDGHICRLVDYPDSGDAFPGVQIKGGICYFLWDAKYKGSCNITRVADGQEHIQPKRNLGEFDVLVRDERALDILRKVLAKKEKTVVELVSGDTPFGIATNFSEWAVKESASTIALYLIDQGKRTIGHIKRNQIQKNLEMLDTWKVLVPKAYGAGESYPHQILGKEIVALSPSACTQSYLVIAPFHSKRAANSFASYYRTRLFRFLVSLRKITQDALRSTYTWVPQQSWDKVWTDEDLYKKYRITKVEITYINSMIRSMDESDE
jgi:site-specific DNA-methyltransferase (adenine-specific)